jgi:hypothetical protein
VTRCCTSGCGLSGTTSQNRLPKAPV